MSLDAKIFIQAVDDKQAQQFLYKSETESLWEFHHILNAESPFILEKLYGLLSDDDLEYLKFYIPEEPITDMTMLETKDSKKILDLFRKINSHILEYELKKTFMEDISESHNNWMLSLTRHKARLLDELGQIKGILEIAVQNNWRIKTMIWIF